MRSDLFSTTAGAVFGFATVLALPLMAPAQDALVGPTYSRLRSGADDWHVRGGHLGYGHGGYGYGNGYFQPYVSPVVTGSWYARPYPYHFDYFRGRWNGPGPGAPADCPCDENGSETPTADVGAAGM